MSKRSGKWCFFFPEDEPDYPQRISKLYSEEEYAVLTPLDGDTFGSAQLWETLIVQDVEKEKWDLRNATLHRQPTSNLHSLIKHVWRHLDHLYVMQPRGHSDVYKDNPVIGACRKLCQKSSQYEFRVERKRKSY